VYILETSTNLGQTYSEQLRDSNYEKLLFIGKKLDGDKDCRWVIRDKDGNIVKYGTHQKNFVDMVVDTAKPGDDQPIATADPVCKEILEEKGYTVMDAEQMYRYMCEQAGIDVDEEIAKKIKEPTPITAGAVQGALEAIKKARKRRNV